MFVLSRIQKLTIYGILYGWGWDTNHQDKPEINKHNYAKFLLIYLKWDLSFCFVAWSNICNNLLKDLSILLGESNFPQKLRNSIFCLLWREHLLIMIFPLNSDIFKWTKRGHLPIRETLRQQIDEQRAWSENGKRRKYGQRNGEEKIVAKSYWCNYWTRKLHFV